MKYLAQLLAHNKHSINIAVIFAFIILSFGLCNPLTFLLYLLGACISNCPVVSFGVHGSILPRNSINS